MTLGKLIKAKCCCVCAMSAVTLAFLMFGKIINAGITGTVALVYLIALMLLLAVALEEFVCRRRSVHAEDLQGEMPRV